MDLAPAGRHAGVMQPESSLPKETAEGKRRRWSILERRRIVEETLVPGASVARVARAHSVNANQVFGWRRLYQRGLLGGGASALLPVKVSDGMPPATAGAAVDVHAAATPGSIHVALGKAQIRIEGDVDRDLVRMVLEAVLR